jgi:hypothetical protein
MAIRRTTNVADALVRAEPALVPALAPGTALPAGQAPAPHAKSVRHGDWQYIGNSGN